MGQRAPRARRAVLKPSDFQSKNAGVRGFLYLARNEDHWDGLHKLGQTAATRPDARIDRLNLEHRRMVDIGVFQLLDAVPVSDAYGAEQALFEALDALRPVGGREFFLGNRAFLVEAMSTAARFIEGDGEGLNNLRDGIDPADPPFVPPFAPRYDYSPAGRPPGWVFLARNRFHKIDTYRLSSSVQAPGVVVKKWNEFQRTATSQIGFYEVVYAVPVVNYLTGLALGKQALAPWLLNGTRSRFLRAPLSLLAATLESALDAATGSPVD